MSLAFSNLLFRAFLSDLSSGVGFAQIGAVSGLAVAPSSVPYHSGFIGRRDVLAQLDAEVRQSLYGARLLWLDGDRGLGKTALLNQFLDAIPPGRSVLRANASEDETRLPFSLITQPIHAAANAKSTHCNAKSKHCTASQRREIRARSRRGMLLPGETPRGCRARRPGRVADRSAVCFSPITDIMSICSKTAGGGRTPPGVP